MAEPRACIKQVSDPSDRQYSLLILLAQGLSSRHFQVVILGYNLLIRIKSRRLHNYPFALIILMFNPS